MTFYLRHEVIHISTHAPRVRRDRFRRSCPLFSAISTHAPRVRRDVFSIGDIIEVGNFYSRASCEARPESLMKFCKPTISTHAPRVRRDPDSVAIVQKIRISTHAPRVRRDLKWGYAKEVPLISTHAPRVRRDAENGRHLLK